MHAVTAPRYLSGVILLLLLVHAPSPTYAGKKKQSDQDVFKQAQALEASSGGNAAAEFLLGDSYENGRGVPQDYAEALRWYLKSANRDYAAAQIPLAWLYFSHPPLSDDGNLEEACFWVDVALASNQAEKDGGLSKDGRTRALLLKRMLEGGVLHGPVADKPTPPLLSQEKIAAAQARATNWFAERQQNASGK
jgi:TPR repeat protein